MLLKFWYHKLAECDFYKCRLFASAKPKLKSTTFAATKKYKHLIMSNITFTMLKPDAVSNGYIGAILDHIIKAGFKIKAMKYTHLTAERAGEFYAVHRERPFYNDLVKYMSSGPIVAAILEKDNAVDDFRKIIGATDPSKADAGTIRKLYAKSIEANAVHGSDSNENAAIEGSFFFSMTERF